MVLGPRERLIIRVLYRLRDYEKLFRFVGEDSEKREFLCHLKCLKRKQKSERIRRIFKPTGNLLKDVLELYRIYYRIEVPRDGRIIKADENESHHRLV